MGAPQPRRALLALLYRKNQMPASAPSGSRSHRRTWTFRAGRADAKTAARRAIATRARVSSGSTSRQPTAVGCQPRSPGTTTGTTRRLRSSVDNSSCTSTTWVLTSIRSRVRLAGSHARTSTDPRSPRTLKEYSTRTSQPSRTRSATTCSTTAAWRSSINRGRSAPRHLASSCSQTSTARPTARSVPTVSSAR